MLEQKYSWELDIFGKDGEALFDYMIRNFYTMFDGDNKIKHFDVYSGVYDLRSYVLDIKTNYMDDLQQDLIPWIKQEFENKELFQPTNWRPFCDPFILTSKFLGYRKMFQYKHYIFQLSLLDWCHDSYSCNDCKDDDMYNDCIHFYLAFYGWKDGIHEKLQPYNYIILSDNDKLPEQFWLDGNK
jgi:hypothetical protein